MGAQIRMYAVSWLRRCYAMVMFKKKTNLRLEKDHVSITKVWTF